MVTSFIRLMAAQLAAGDKQLRGVEFRKFANPGKLIELLNKTVEADQKNRG